jgi:hypothetical protein
LLNDNLDPITELGGLNVDESTPGNLWINGRDGNLGFLMSGKGSLNLARSISVRRSTLRLTPPHQHAATPTRRHAHTPFHPSILPSFHSSFTVRTTPAQEF